VTHKGFSKIGNDEFVGTGVAQAVERITDGKKGDKSPAVAKDIFL
jgi:hypothetical protein